jgi:hypothetical protein
MNILYLYSGFHPFNKLAKVQTGMSTMSNMSASVSRGEEEEETPAVNRIQTSPGDAEHYRGDHSGKQPFIRQLDYPEDNDVVSGILHMEEPSDEPGPFKPFLTPASGDPSNNPAYSQRLLNPDLYGAKTNTKSLAMVNSKIQWNGK